VQFLNVNEERNENKKPHSETKTKKIEARGGRTPTKSYHKCTSTPYTHCHNHLSHIFLLISPALLSSM
jgi:hypothetical protein